MMLGLVWRRVKGRDCTEKVNNEFMDDVHSHDNFGSDEVCENFTEGNEIPFVVSDMERVESNAVNASDKDKECSD